MIEIRLNDDGTLDEIVGRDVSFHLEQTADTQWWMVLYEEGKTGGVHVRLTTARAKIEATVTDER